MTGNPLLDILITIFGGGFLTWMGWVSFNVIDYIKHKKDSVNAVKAMSDLSIDLKNSFNEMRGENKEDNEKTRQDIDKMNKRLDLFLKNEIDEFKSIAEDLKSK